jgi:bifunctional DNase/RNase
MSLVAAVLTVHGCWLDALLTACYRREPRLLPIRAGPVEAAALALTLDLLETPRPLTCQMAARVLEAGSSPCH